MVKDLVPDHLQRLILKDVPNEITIQDCHFRPLRGVRRRLDWFWNRLWGCLVRLWSHLEAIFCLLMAILPEPLAKVSFEGCLERNHHSRLAHQAAQKLSKGVLTGV